MPRGQGSTNFPQRSLACAGRAAGTLFPEWADTELFRFLSYNILFIYCEMILLWYVQGLPSFTQPHLNHQQSPGKLPRETPVSSSVRMVPCFCLWQLQILPDKGLPPHLRHVLLWYAVSFCRNYFSTQGIAKPQYVPTQAGIQKVPVAPQDYCFFLFFFCSFGVGLGMPWDGSRSEHHLWHMLMVHSILIM